MNVTCPDCSSIFRVDPARVPADGVRARCTICGAVMAVEHPSAPASLTHAPSADAASDGATQDPIDAVLPPASEETGAAVLEPVPQPVFEPALQAEPSVSAAEPAAAAPARPGRPVNPYLNNTPELRARRLARALVSDLVAYNPQKREEGLRDGTLRQLFRDEIRKSWDEYVEQVGAAVAESTPHFQDALNDVLAGGRRVF